MGIFSWLRRVSYRARHHLARKYPNKVTQRYLDDGIEFGDAVSMIYMGECDGFEKFLAAWERAEREYAELGFRTISLDTFTRVGGWGGDFSHEPVEVRREPGEEPVFHAALYREHFLGKMPVSNLVQKVFETGEVQSGHYRVPSTLALIKKEVP